VGLPASIGVQADVSETEALLECIKSAINDDFTREPQGSDELSQSVAALIRRCRDRSSSELDDVVKTSISVNETAAMSAKLLYDLRHIDGEAQGIAAAAEEMAATVNEVAQHGEEIKNNVRRANEASSISEDALSETSASMTTINRALVETSEGIGVVEELGTSISAIAADIRKIAVADQHSGHQCGCRGCPRWRGRSWLCGDRRRGQGTVRPDCGRDTGNR
jgi:methyl-accepting chemotaxis protein